MTRLWRLLIALAGLMGATGVALAAKAAHDADASRLATASMMLLFHACALLGTVALAERGVIHRRIGLIAALGFALGPALFAGDLLMRQFAGDRLDCARDLRVVAPARLIRRFAQQAAIG